MREPKYTLTYYEDCSFCGGNGCSYCVDGYRETSKVFENESDFKHELMIVQSNPNTVLVIRRYDED